MAVKYQCSLEYHMVVGYHVEWTLGDFDRTPSGGGQTLDDSSYEHPIAMGCCSELDDVPEDSCTLPHHEACFTDLIQHACYSVEKLMKEDAELVVFGMGHDAVVHAAAEVANLRQDCFDTLWRGGDDVCDAGEVCGMDLCDVAHTSFLDLPTWNAGISVAYGGSTVSEIQLDLRALLAGNVLAPLPDPPDACSDQHSNDGVPPPTTSPGAIGSFLAPVTEVPIDLVGPEYGGEVIAATGAFAEGSDLHRYFTSTNQLAIDYWVMVEAEPTTVGTSAIQSDVDGFQLQLAGAELFPLVSGLYRQDAGAVFFHLSASIDGQGDAVLARNKNTLAFYKVAGGVGACPTAVAQCLVSRPFTIQYDDAFGGRWELDIPSTTWRP